MKLKKYTVALTAVINEVCIGWSQEKFYLMGTQAGGRGRGGGENLVGQSTGDIFFWWGNDQIFGRKNNFLETLLEIFGKDCNC